MSSMVSHSERGELLKQAVGLVLHYTTLSCLLWMVVAASGLYKHLTKRHPLLLLLAAAADDDDEPQDPAGVDEPAEEIGGEPGAFRSSIAVASAQMTQFLAISSGETGAALLPDGLGRAADRGGHCRRHPPGTVRPDGRRRRRAAALLPGQDAGAGRRRTARRHPRPARPHLPPAHLVLPAPPTQRRPPLGPPPGTSPSTPFQLKFQQNSIHPLP